MLYLQSLKTIILLFEVASEFGDIKIMKLLFSMNYLIQNILEKLIALITIFIDRKLSYSTVVFKPET